MHEYVALSVNDFWRNLLVIVPVFPVSLSQPFIARLSSPNLIRIDSQGFPSQCCCDEFRSSTSSVRPTRLRRVLILRLSLDGIYSIYRGFGDPGFHDVTAVYLQSPFPCLISGDQEMRKYVAVSSGFCAMTTQKFVVNSLSHQHQRPNISFENYDVKCSTSNTRSISELNLSRDCL